MTARSSSGEAQATASTLLPGSSTITLASSARPAARATAGRPAPDSTASETSSRAPRKPRASAGRAAPRLRFGDAGILLGVSVVRPDDQESDRRADPEQGGEGEERQE